MTSETNPTRDVKADRGKHEETKDRLINLDAKPEAIMLDPAMTAVIVVDMQNDFGSKGGMFDRAGIDISGIQKAVGPTVKVLAAARKMGVQARPLTLGRTQFCEPCAAPGGRRGREGYRSRWQREPHPDPRHLDHGHRY